MAGMTAASTLLENGISDFLIIEAQSILGGRMKETKFGGYTIELGPSWIQGIRNNETGEENPIWTLANKHKLMNIYTDYEDLLTFDQNGLTNYSNIINQAFDKFDQVVDDAEKRLALGLEDLSFAQGLSLQGWIPRTPHEKVAGWWAFDFEYADTPSASSMIETAIHSKTSYAQWSEDN
ncbi:unnamed protein product, partial [Rotaria sp. Silwood2]